MISIFRGRRSTLESFIFILQCRRSTLGVSSCVFLNRIVRLRCHNVQMGVGHRESVILHGRRSTDDVATCHSRLDPPPLPSTLFVSHAIPRSPLCTLGCAVDIPHLQSTPYNQHSTIYTLQSTLYILLHSTHSTLHSTFYTPHFTL